MARVAMANGINANLLRRWVAQANGRSLAPPTSTDANEPSTVESSCDDAGGVAVAAAAFVPVKVETRTASELHIEIVRGNVQVKLAWPLDAAAQSALWLRELLR
jgi:transposase